MTCQHPACNGGILLDFEDGLGPHCLSCGRGVEPPISQEDLAFLSKPLRRETINRGAGREPGGFVVSSGNHMGGKYKHRGVS